MKPTIIDHIKTTTKEQAKKARARAEDEVEQRLEENRLAEDAYEDRVEAAEETQRDQDEA